MDNYSISLEKTFSFIREKGPVLVAVSGGSDSMALLFLANAWARKNEREVLCVSVDHGLRPEAVAEAAYVAMVCEGLGIVHTTLAWDGVKPVTGISAAARNARYELMAEFASDFGIRIILTGHTRDDQAETVLMRLRRSANNGASSSRGHSGMCRRVLLGGSEGGISLLRPLLHLSRAQLREYLNEISQSWIEDPSNHDVSFERVRVRNELAEKPDFKDRLVEYSQVMGRWREVNCVAAAQFLMQHCSCKPGHVFEINIANITSVPEGVVMMAIKTVLATAGGGNFLVPDSQLEPVLRRIKQEGIGRVTLGNCIVENNSVVIRIFREARNLNSEIIGRGQSGVWDGRVHFSNDSDEDIQIEAMTVKYLAEVEAGGSGIFEGIKKAVLLSSPLVTTASGISIPLHFDKSFLPAQLDVRTGANAIENYCPQWDFALLEWLKEIDLAVEQRDMLVHAIEK
ncbi:MAG: tRNA lysidine(34) synthetase TilS [Rhizobiaceae bacterium]|nr:tRNA lysidine(34) synthetase TilS [Rhizobiaceae bacterium]